MSVEFIPLYRQELMDNNQFWVQKIEQAQSAEELAVWAEYMRKTSTLLMEKARVLSNIELYEASRELINAGEEAYTHRKNQVPETTQLIPNALWSSGGLGLSLMGIASFFAAPVVVPVTDVALGITTWGYAAWEFMRRTKAVADDAQTHQSLAVREESGIRLGASSIAIALGVMGIVELAGVFPPLAALVIASCAIVPVAVDAVFRVKDYYDTKKAIKVANEEGDKRIKALSELVNHFSIENSPRHVLRHVQQEADVEALFKRPTMHSPDTNRFGGRSAAQPDIELPNRNQEDEKELIGISNS